MSNYNKTNLKVLGRNINAVIICRYCLFVASLVGHHCQRHHCPVYVYIKDIIAPYTTTCLKYITFVLARLKESLLDPLEFKVACQVSKHARLCMVFISEWFLPGSSWTTAEVMPRNRVDLPDDPPENGSESSRKVGAPFEINSKISD